MALYEARRGYGIMQLVEELSNGRVRLGAGTIYGAIKKLQGDDRKKEYIITDSGEKAVKYEIFRLRELFDNGIRITKGEGNMHKYRFYIDHESEEKWINKMAER